MALDLPFFRTGAKFREELTAERLNKMVAAIRSLEIQPGTNVRVSRTTGGTTLKASVPRQRGSGAASSSCPFRVSLTSTTAGYTAVVKPGTINGLLATNYAQCAASNLSTLTGTTAAVRYVMIDADTDGKQLTSYDLTITSTAPAAPTPTTPLAPTTFTYPLAVVATSGIVYQLSPCNQLGAYVYESVRVAKTLSSAQDNAFDIYYYWAVR